MLAANYYPSAIAVIGPVSRHSQQFNHAATDCDTFNSLWLRTTASVYVYVTTDTDIVTL